MNLKEAFRYQNYLKRIMETMGAYLTTLDRAFRQHETHLRSRANPDEQDEEIDILPARLYPYTTDQVFGFYAAIVREKIDLCAAIERAKAAYPFNYDAAMNQNKARQAAIQTLRTLMACRQEESERTDKAYRINVEGNQTPYYYNVKVTKTPDFDKDSVRAQLSTLQRDADAASAEIDKASVEIPVDFTPAFDVNDDIPEALEKFLK